MKAVPDNNDLITGFHNGEETTVKRLYFLHYRSLCYFAEKILNNKEEAEDIAVESFLKLLEKKEDFTDLLQIKSFLYTVTRNACFDRLRKNKVRDRAGRQLELLNKADQQSGEDEMIVAKVLQVIYAEVEQLPGQCRQVFKSVFFEGKNTAAIASEMGLSPQTVLNQKAKALKILRMALYREGLYSTALYFYCLLLLSSKFRS